MLTCAVLTCGGQTGKAARLKAEGPVGRQSSPGDRCSRLGRGGGHGGGEKWLDSGRPLTEDPREFPDPLDVGYVRKRACQAHSEFWGLSKWHLWVKCCLCLISLPVPHRKSASLWVAGLPWQRATQGKQWLPRRAPLRLAGDHSIVEWLKAHRSLLTSLTQDNTEQFMYKMHNTETYRTSSITTQRKMVSSSRITTIFPPHKLLLHLPAGSVLQWNVVTIKYPSWIHQRERVCHVPMPSFSVVSDSLGPNGL